MNTFIEFINTLDYVSVETIISDYQMEEVGARLQMLNDGEMKIRPWEDAKEYIFI
ncbi:MAG: hypothetical protein JHD28_10305 [Bacteroidia bacterium]|nr:hypothetical protein [Bacteroidia bacterium]